MTGLDNGNVGIGTTSPGAQLDVYNSGNATIKLATNSGSSADGGLLRFYQSAASFIMGQIKVIPGSSYNNSLMTFSVANGSRALLDRMVIDNNGNVGIGTTNPNYRLTVTDGSAPETSAQDIAGAVISVQGDGKAYFMGRDTTNDIEFIMGTSSLGTTFAGSMTAHDFQLRTNNTTRVTIQKTSGNVGIGTTAPDSTLHVSGSVGFKVVSTNNSSYTAGNETIILANASGAGVTIALPVASTCTDRVYTVKKSDSSGNTVTIDPNGSELIEGATTKVISAQYETVTIISDGTAWWII